MVYTAINNMRDILPMSFILLRRLKHHMRMDSPNIAYVRVPPIILTPHIWVSASVDGSVDSQRPECTAASTSQMLWSQRMVGKSNRRPTSCGDRNFGNIRRRFKLPVTPESCTYTSRAKTAFNWMHTYGLEEVGLVTYWRLST